MKFLLLAVIAYIVVWWLRRALSGPTRPRAAARPAEVAAPEPMLRCLECGLHLPRDDALPGRGGVFCGEPHRAAWERSHPGAPG